MYNKSIVTEDEKEAYIQIWKYLSSNGKLFMPVEKNDESSAVFTEEDDEGNKTIRVFMDNTAIQVYISEIGTVFPSEAPLKVGIAPVRLLQKKLAEVYGKEKEDGKNVECVLTTYDEDGNMRNIDIIWTQNGI